MNPLLKRLESPQRHGRKSEQRVAKKLGARLTPGSGAIEGAKGDAVLPDFLIESKATVNKSFSLRLEVLEKISKEALSRNKKPAISVSFVNGAGVAVRHGDWVAVPLEVWKELICSS